MSFNKILFIATATVAICGNAHAATSLTFQWDQGGLSNSSGVAVSTSDYVIGFGTFSIVPSPGDSFSSVEAAFDEVVSASADTLLFGGIPGFYQNTFTGIESGAYDGQQIYLFARNTAGTEYGVFTTGELFGDESAVPPVSAATFTGQTAILQTIIGGDMTGPELFAGLGPSYQLITAPVDNDFETYIGGFGLDPADQGFDDDPDGDRLRNGVEAWFGTNPAERNAGLAELSSDGTVTVFSHPQNENPVTDVSGFYQWSPDLVEWFPSGGGPGGGPTVTIVAQTVGDTTTVTATSSIALGRIFLRVGTSRL